MHLYESYIYDYQYIRYKKSSMYLKINQYWYTIVLEAWYDTGKRAAGDIYQKSAPG